MKKSVYFHIENSGFIPVGPTFDNITNIDTYQNNIIDEIYIQDLLDYYEDKTCSPLLSLLVQKLAVGGNIYIQSTDLKQLGIAIAFGEIEESTVKNILYPNKKSIHTMNDIISMIQSLGMEVETKKYLNIFEYSISAKKL